MARDEGPLRLVQAVYALCMGGSEALAHQIAGGLNKNGTYACSIYAVDHGGPLAEVLAGNGIPFRVFDRRGAFDLRLLLALARQFRAEGIQLVHTHHLCQLMYAGVAARLTGARVIHTEHEFYSLQSPRVRHLLRLLASAAFAVTAVAEPVADHLRGQVGLPAKKVVTIPNGVDIPRFHRAQPAPRTIFGWKNEDCIIGCIGRLEPEKGQETLLQAFHRVRSSCGKAKLLLIGDGGERTQLMARARSLGLNGSVRFLGVRRDIPELLAACDVVAVPSNREGLPMVLLEAMAASKPVVATKVGSIPRVVVEGRTGLLVPAAESEALADTLLRLLYDPSQRQRMGREGVAIVKAHYSFDRTLEQYKNLYAQAMGGMS